MISWIVENLLSSLWGVLGTTTVIVIICGVLAWFIPPLRKPAIWVGSLALAVATVYAKGQRDRARLEAQRKEEAVRRVNQKYDTIEKRPDTPGTVTDRLNKGTF